MLCYVAFLVALSLHFFSPEPRHFYEFLNPNRERRVEGEFLISCSVGYI